MKRKRKLLSLFVAVLAALTLAMMMSAAVFADDGETVYKYSYIADNGWQWQDDSGIIQSIKMKVGEKVIIDNQSEKVIGVFKNDGSGDIVENNGVLSIENSNGVITVTALQTGTSQIIAYDEGSSVYEVEARLPVTVEASTYKFEFYPGDTEYDGLRSRMQSNLKSAFGQANAWVFSGLNGAYDVEITSEKALTYKDVLGEGGALEKAYAGAQDVADSYRVGFGTKASPTEYKDSAALEEERNSDALIPFNGADFYALTAEYIFRVDLTAAAPKCGDTIAYNQQIGELPAGAHPEVTVPSGANYSVFTYEGIPYAHWLNGETQMPEGEVLKGDTEYVALIALKPDFGYCLGDRTNVTINNVPATVRTAETEGVIEVTAPITAVHDWDEGVITKEPTTAEEGVKTFTCKACHEATKTEPVPKKAKEDTSGTNTVKKGQKATVKGNTYKVLSTSAKARTVAFTKAKKASKVTVPATVTIEGKKYKVTTVNAKAFTAKQIRTVTIGKNVKQIKANAFSNSKVTKVILKTKALKKAKVKDSLKKSKVRTVKVSVGKKSVNKKYVTKYKKYFTKKNAGKKVAVK